jgi:hypothetical protein
MSVAIGAMGDVGGRGRNVSSRGRDVGSRVGDGGGRAGDIGDLYVGGRRRGDGEGESSAVVVAGESVGNAHSTRR